MKTIQHIIIFWSLTIAAHMSAQTAISLEEALKIATENNKGIKGAEILSAYHQRLKDSYRTIDPLSASVEFGQFNSEKTDSRLTVEQNFRLPGFYRSQRRVLEEESRNADIQADLQKWDLRREVALLYNELEYSSSKIRILKRADSLYSQYFKRANLRFQKGETNTLENASAQNMRGEAQLQLRALQSHREVLLSQFNFLLNSENQYTNEAARYEPLKMASVDSTDKLQHLRLQKVQQEISVQKARVAAERAKLLPSFNLGYNNMSISGAGSSGQRFHSVMGGVALPVFNKAQKAAIEAEEIRTGYYEKQYQLEADRLRNQQEQYVLQQKKLQDEIDYYEQTAQRNAKTMLTAANRLLYEGEINYLEWTVITNQALETERKFVDTVYEFNKTVLGLQALTQSYP